MIRNCFRQSMASSLKIGYPRIQLKVDHHFSTWKVVIIIPDSPLLMGYRLQQVTLEVIWVPWWWSHCQHWGDSGSAVPRPFPGSFFGGKNLWETLALMGKTYGKPTGFSMFFPFIKGEHLSETRRCFFVSAFFSHADQGVPVSLHPRQTSPAGTGERKRFTVALKFRIWWRPKNIPKWWSSPTRIFGKTLVGQRSPWLLTRTINAAERSTASKVLLQFGTHSNPSSDWSHFSLFWWIALIALIAHLVWATSWW